jgi:hypothetical protein
MLFAKGARFLEQRIKPGLTQVLRGNIDRFPPT